MKQISLLLIWLFALAGCNDKKAESRSQAQQKKWLCSWNSKQADLTLSEMRTTPLHEAVYRLDIRSVGRLLTTTSVDIRDGMGRTALFVSTFSGIPDPSKIPYQNITAKVLEQENHKRKEDNRKKSEIAKLLLAKGASIDVQDQYGSTPLMASLFSYERVEPYHLEILKILIEKSSNTNLQDRDGNTALINAVTIGNESAVKLLRAKGADPNIKRCDGKTALDLAHESKSPELIAALK
jgi:ankyrin repeat protein